MITIIKKLISSLLNLILLLAVTTLCAILVARNILTGENIFGLLNNQEINNNIDYSSLLPNSQNNELYKEIEEYIDTEAITKELGDLITDYLKYSSGITGSEPPSTNELKEIIKNSSSKYEEKTGKKIDTDEINKQLDDIEVKLSEENALSKNDTYKQAFQFIYNDKYIYLTIGVIVICIILLLFLNNLESLIKHLIAVSLFNGIGNIAFGFALNKIIDTEINHAASSIISNLTNTFNKTAILSFTISGVLLLIYIIIKLIKKINKSTNTIENKSEANNTQQDSEFYNQELNPNTLEKDINDINNNFNN